MSYIGAIGFWSENDGKASMMASNQSKSKLQLEAVASTVSTWMQDHMIASWSDW